MNGFLNWILRWVLRFGFLAGLVAIITWLTLVPADPNLFPAKEAERPVWVVDHGWHTGLVVGQAELRAASRDIALVDRAAAERLLWLTTRYPGAEWIEIGWGDADFYQATPTLDDVDILKGLEALVVPTDSALQIVPGWGPPSAAFATSDMVRLPLSIDGFQRLTERLAESLPAAEGVEPLGVSLYGDGQFYPAEPSYHLFRTCNHWIGALLRAAGVPSSHIPSTFSSTLTGELRLRAVGIEDDLQ